MYHCRYNAQLAFFICCFVTAKKRYSKNCPDPITVSLPSLHAKEHTDNLCLMYEYRHSPVYQDLFYRNKNCTLLFLL